jgi:hypothetical protein
MTVKAYTVESLIAVLAGICVAGCKNEQPKAEPQPATVPASSVSGSGPAAVASNPVVAAQEVPPAAGSAAPAPAGSAKKGEKKCAPGGCAPGKCG